MLAGARLLVGQHVEQKPDRPHVERDEDEAPPHHRRLGIIAELIDRDISRGQPGEDEPGDEKIVDRLDEHLVPLSVSVRTARHSVNFPRAYFAFSIFVTVT